MSSVSATIEAPVSAVWAALVDPDTYPDWLIGARRIRRVEDGWPRPGTSFHHVVGLGGPLSIADRTTALEVQDQRLLKMEVRARPLVHGSVTFTLEPADGGRSTTVTVEEHPVGLHRVLTPVLTPLAAARNRTSLEKLERTIRA